MIEWLRFLKQIDRETPKELDVHLIVDNCATHKHAKVKAWLAGRLSGVANSVKLGERRPLKRRTKPCVTFTLKHPHAAAQNARGVEG